MAINKKEKLKKVKGMILVEEIKDKEMEIQKRKPITEQEKV